jgi:hypothetical protein
MALKLTQLAKGDANKDEHVVLDVIADCDLNYFAVADTTYFNDGKISSKLRHFHWFAPKKVSEGDKIALYTKKGVDREQMVGNVRWHVIFWGLDSKVWNNDTDAAVVLSLKTWSTLKA